MPEVILSELEIDKLKAICGPVAIRSPEGEMIGVFTPSRPLDDLDREMLEKIRQRRGKSEKTYTTQDVLDHLKQLETNECRG